MKSLTLMFSVGIIILPLYKFVKWCKVIIKGDQFKADLSKCFNTNNK